MHPVKGEAEREEVSQPKYYENLESYLFEHNNFRSMQETLTSTFIDILINYFSHKQIRPINMRILHFQLKYIDTYNIRYN